MVILILLTELDLKKTFLEVTESFLVLKAHFHFENIENWYTNFDIIDSQIIFLYDQ